MEIHCNVCNGKPLMKEGKLPEEYRGRMHVVVMECEKCGASVLYDRCENY